MEILLENIGRRYNRNWIFRGISTIIPSGTHCAILGPNGSGKSTLLQVLSGSLRPSEGSLRHQLDQIDLPEDQVAQLLSIATPYLELLEELTLEEHIRFHFQFRKQLVTDSPKQLAERMQLGTAFRKQVKVFSSGMKQRLKLGLAFFSESSLLLLDEPLSNLDEEGAVWYKGLIEQYTSGRTVLIASNQPQEYASCSQYIHIKDFKK